MLKDNQTLKIQTGSPDPTDANHQRMTFKLIEVIMGPVEPYVIGVEVTMWAHSFKDFNPDPAWLLFMVILDLQNQMHWAIYKHFNLEAQDDTREG